MDAQQPNLDIESAKLDIEHLKLELELSKLELEKNKAKWSAIAIIAPIIVTVITLGFNSWSQTQQAKQQMASQSLQTKQQIELQCLQSNNQLKIVEEQAKSQLESKVADVLLNEKDPIAAYNKARAMGHIFKDRLPENFAIEFKNSLENSGFSPTETHTPRGKSKWDTHILYERAGPKITICPPKLLPLTK